MPLKLLLIRRGVYYFRWQIPPVLRAVVGQREFIRSLATTSFSIALRRASQHYKLVELLKDATRDFRMKKLTEENYAYIVRLIWELHTKPSSDYSADVVAHLATGNHTSTDFTTTFARCGGPELISFIEGYKAVEKALADGEYDSRSEHIPAPALAEEPYDSIDEMEHFEDGVDRYISFLKKAIQTRRGGYGGEEDYRAYEFHRPFAAMDLLRLGIKDTDPRMFEKLLRDYVHLEIYNLEKAQNHFTTEPYTLPEHIASLASGKDGEAREEISELPDPPTTRDNYLTSRWAEYKKDKMDEGKWKIDSNIAERDAEFRDFLELTGGDRDCSHFTKDDARQFRSGLLTFPKNRQKHYPKIALADIPPEAVKISRSTARQRLDVIKGFFKWLHKSEYINTSPFAQVLIDGEPVSYGSYSSQDIRELFNLPERLVKTPWQFWIPRIALYSGARQDEIAQLNVEDIKLDPDDQVWYFSINQKSGKTLKTKAAIRRVPIHSELIAHGFLDYFQDCRSKRARNESLWEDLRPKAGSLGQTVSRYWNRLKSVHEVLTEPQAEDGGEKVFHSLRKLAITKMFNAGVQTDTLQLLVGHEPNLGVTARYVERIFKPMHQLKQAIEEIKIEGISWEKHYRDIKKCST